MFQWFIGAAGLALIILPANIASAQDATTSTITLDEETCEIVSGDFGAPSATLHVTSHCQGMGGWTLVLHEYAKSEGVSLAYGEDYVSPELPILSHAPIGRVLDSVDWLKTDDDGDGNDEIAGLVIGYAEENWQKPPPNQYLNYYAIALKGGDTPVACPIARLEGLTKRGADNAAAVAVGLFADQWSCETDKALVFTAESTGSTSYVNAVYEKARELGFMPPD